jgi:hypothetical protein
MSPRQRREREMIPWENLAELVDTQALVVTIQLSPDPKRKRLCGI